MQSFVVRVLINGVALWVASWLLPGMDISSSATSDAVATSGVTEGAEAIGIALAYLFIGLIFGVVNALVKPLISLLSLPITCLTLGLFAVIINAGMLYLTAWISTYTPVDFTLDSFFWTAILGAIVISLISLVSGLLPGKRPRS